jgi:hypothetical protein
MAETEISLWGKECLCARRIPTLAKLDTETTAWNERVNDLRRTITWNFNIKAARKKFRLKAR